MKNILSNLVAESITKLSAQDIISDSIDSTDIKISDNKNKDFGQYTTNIAMVIAKNNKQNPKQLAQLIVDNIEKGNLLQKVNIAGVGFINFFLKLSVFYDNIFFYYKK